MSIPSLGLKVPSGEMEEDSADGADDRPDEPKREETLTSQDYYFDSYSHFGGCTAHCFGYAALPALSCAQFGRRAGIHEEMLKDEGARRGLGFVEGASDL